MKTVHSIFGNIFKYAAAMEQMCQNAYPEKFEYTFCSDFAIGDWFGTAAVIDTYNRVKANWLCNYRSWTEVVIALNLLAWTNHFLKQQGFADRDKFIELYSNLYDKAVDEFYKTFNNNEEAKYYFYKKTD